MITADIFFQKEQNWRKWSKKHLRREQIKIAVTGKGGCGKSTVTSLLAKALARQGKEILVIDSDESNYGLHRQLGMKLPRDFTDYFGGKQNVLNDMMLSKFTHQFF